MTGIKTSDSRRLPFQNERTDSAMTDPRRNTCRRGNATAAGWFRRLSHDLPPGLCYRAGMSKPAVTNIIAIEDLFERLPPKARLLGIDLGTKTIGLGVSDVERRIASPLETIRRKKFTEDARELVAHAQKQQAFAYVIGLPLNMDGSEGPRAQATRAFIRNMAPLDARPFVFWDERLSTAAVTRELIAQDASRAKRAEVVDRMAAAYILQGVLDRLAAIARSTAQ